MNTYNAYYKGRQIEVQASTSVAAQQAAAHEFKARKSYDITVMLVEKNGTPYTHSTAEL